jgi:iron(III) transport system substrate-binding protein
MEALQREGLLQPVASPHLANLRPEAVPAHKGWAASFLSVWVQAYNTAKVKKDELPKRYQDLADPRWKDRLGIEAKNNEWFYTIVKDMGEEQGLRLFRQMAANGLSVRYGTALLNNLVASGEVPLALTVYNFMVEQAKQKGAAIDWFVIEPAIARGNAVGVSKRSPHPHAAVLFYDFMLGPAQPLLASLHHVPTSTRIESPLKNVSIKLVDPATVLDESERSTRLYEETVLQRTGR